MELIRRAAAPFVLPSNGIGHGIYFALTRQVGKERRQVSPPASSHHICYALTEHWLLESCRYVLDHSQKNLDVVMRRLTHLAGMDGVHDCFKSTQKPCYFYSCDNNFKTQCRKKRSLLTTSIVTCRNVCINFLIKSFDEISDKSDVRLQSFQKKSYLKLLTKRIRNTN